MTSSASLVDRSRYGFCNAASNFVPEANNLGGLALTGDPRFAGRHGPTRWHIPMTFVLVILMWIITMAAGVYTTFEISSSLSTPQQSTAVVSYNAILVYSVITVWVAMVENTRAEDKAYKAASVALRVRTQDEPAERSPT